MHLGKVNKGIILFKLFQNIALRGHDDSDRNIMQLLKYQNLHDSFIMSIMSNLQQESKPASSNSKI